MEFNKNSLTEELSKNPYYAVELAKLGDASLLNLCFDILVEIIKQSTDLRPTEWYTNLEGQYNDLSLIEEITMQINCVLDVKEKCLVEFNNSYAKTHGIKPKKPTKKELQENLKHKNLSKHLAEKKVAKILIDEHLGDINFKSVERYNDMVYNQQEK